MWERDFIMNSIKEGDKTLKNLFFPIQFRQ